MDEEALRQSQEEQATCQRLDEEALKKEPLNMSKGSLNMLSDKDVSKPLAEADKGKKVTASSQPLPKFDKGPKAKTKAKLQGKNFNFDAQGTRSTPHKAFDVEESE
ncbi:hypothetical protein Tco_1041174 [Tanacetum coccineum]|uniref:Uncharacterized protein n=1 Tax=Tanacetum coccineum TaxID=301880 RepID=A0ABQ5GH44_9ASTR